MSDDCFVYVISTLKNGEACAPVKIGLASNPRGRLASIQTGSPIELALTYAFPMHGDRQMARFIERVVHEVGASNRLHGEWFDLHPFCAIQLVAKTILGVWLEHCPQDLLPSDKSELFRASGVQDAFDFSALIWPSRISQDVAVLH